VHGKNAFPPKRSVFPHYRNRFGISIVLRGQIMALCVTRLKNWAFSLNTFLRKNGASTQKMLDKLTAI
jgi:hypothetical protein